MPCCSVLDLMRMEGLRGREADKAGMERDKRLYKRIEMLRHGRQTLRYMQLLICTVFCRVVTAEVIS